MILLPNVSVAANQAKTVRFFVDAPENPLNNAMINKDFTIYIGDSFGGAANPVKSVFFNLTGVYTGGGDVISVSLNSNPATRRQFFLPVVAAPTPFEIIYRDPADTINPISAGAYQHTINLGFPAAVTVYGLGVTGDITYRYSAAACSDGQAGNQKIKTVYTFVGSSDNAVNFQIDKSFSVYIGDNISGIGSAIKSAVYNISGVYSGSGNLGLGVNGFPGSVKFFILPPAAAPTPFEIVYRDPADTINPFSPGKYNYIFNVVPSGITLYGFAATLGLTYQYKPAGCSSATGELVSSIFDTTLSSAGPAYNSILWNGSLGTGKVRLKIATSNNVNGPWVFMGPDPGCSILSASDSDWYVAGPGVPLEIGCVAAHAGKRYFKYKIQLCMASDCSSYGAQSPGVRGVVVNWSP